MPGQISREVKLARAKKLRALGYRLSRAYREKFSGRELTVLPEKERDGVFSGKTEYYFDVAFTGDDLLDKEEKAVLGRLIKIRLVNSRIFFIGKLC